MAVNLALKWSDKLGKRFRLKSLTSAAVGVKHDFIGVKTVTVKTLTSQALEDYNRTVAGNRFGTLGEVQDTIQELVLTKDRSKPISIDKGNYKQGMELATAAEVIAMQMDEVYVPEVDTYRLAVLAAAATANSQVATVAITKLNAYEQFLAANVVLDNKLVTSEGRIAFVTPTFYNFIKQDITAIMDTELGQKVKFSGMMGELDGCKIVKVPSGRMPANAAFIIMHPSCFCAPEQIHEATVHVDPPNFSGTQVNFRFIYDAFVMDSKKDAVYFHKIV